jgi:periplasmic divalent cation tolerance protein
MTTSNKDEAMKIIRTLLEERLIACGNIITSVTSFFWWQGNIEKEKEVLVIMKSHEKKFQNLTERIKSLHSYDIPEIIAIPIVNGSKAYLDWLQSCLELVS